MIIEFIKDIFTVPFGFVLGLFYNLTNNYIAAIILLTLTVKLLFLPQAIKQQKYVVQSTKINKQIKALKAKYADDIERFKKEANELKKHKEDPKLGSGCLSFIFQLVIMISLFGVIYTPLTNVLRIDDQTIETMNAIIQENSEIEKKNESMIEIHLLKETEKHVEELLSNNVLSNEQINEIISFKEKYNFFGIELSESPELKQFNALWLIPTLVLSIGISTALYSLIRKKKLNPTHIKFAAIEAFPFITSMIMFLFTFMFPAGVGLYWAISNLLSLIQTIALNIIYDPFKVQETDEFEYNIQQNNSEQEENSDEPLTQNTLPTDENKEQTIEA